MDRRAGPQGERPARLLGPTRVGAPLLTEFDPELLGDTASELLGILQAAYGRVIDMKTAERTSFTSLGDTATDLLCLRV